MAEMQSPDRVHVAPSSDGRRPIRVEVPGRPAMDVTRAELVQLQYAIRTYLQRTFPAPSVRRESNAGS
jgi:hypothetical protein